MNSKISIYKSINLSDAQKASRYACERYLELGLPVLMLGSSQAHSGISMPALNSKISRGYSFHLINKNNFKVPISSLALGILMDLDEVEFFQLELIFKIAKLQQRKLYSLQNLQACTAWLINNFFEIPSWYGQLNFSILTSIQYKLFLITKHSKLFTNDIFSLHELKSKDYLGYGVCNLIDTDCLTQEQINLIIAALLEINTNNKPALVIENLNSDNAIDILKKQVSFCQISITSTKELKPNSNANIIDTNRTELNCRSAINNMFMKNFTNSESIRSNQL